MKLRKSLFLTILSLFLWPQIGHSRVFSFSGESFGAYFRGAGALSRLEQKPFENATGTSETFNSEKHSTNFAAELGFVLNAHKNVSIRGGAEVIQSKVSEIQAFNPANSSQKWYDLESNIFMFNPNVVIEYHFWHGKSSRLSLYGGVGYGQVSMDLIYDFTGDYPPATADFTEKSEATVLTGDYGIKYEFLLVDTSTMVLETGFKHAQVTSFKHKHDVTTPTGTFTKGSQVRDSSSSGPVRSLDLGGYYVGIAFRFWLEL